MRRFGLTGPQLIILKEVAKQEQVTVSGVAKAVSLGQSTVTGILERLEKRGLVVRRRSTTDRRKVIISITESCQKLMEKAPPPLQEHFIQSFDSLEEWEQAMILASLKRLVYLMDAKSIKVAPILVETGAISEGSGNNYLK